MVRTPWQMTLGLWRGAVDMIAPPRCLACHRQLAQDSSLCPACWSRLNHIDQPVCDVTGTPFAYAQGDGAVSAAALADPPPWSRARAAVAFDDAARPLVHGLKYRDTPEAGLLMARLMARAGRELLADADIIVPVPLHRLRLWQRRFNQSSVLAARIGKGSGRPVRHDLLLRVRRTASQVGLDHAARRRNVKGAFRVAPAAAVLAGRRVLLVDDVMTTGATAGGCAQALLAAGAAGVDVLVFALVLEPRRLHI